jgi:hypothetical protein
MVSMKIHDACARLFERLGWWVGKHPKRAICLPLLAVCVLGSGLAFLEVASEYKEIWVPRHTAAFRATAFLDAHFAPAPRVAQLLVALPEGGGGTPEQHAAAGALHKPALARALRMHAALVAGGLGAVCLKAHGGADAPCVVHSLLDAFGFNASVLAGTPAAAIGPMVRDLNGAAGLTSGAPMVLKRLVGGLSAAQPTVSARLLQFTYFLQAAEGAAMAWEKAVFVPTAVAFNADPGAGATGSEPLLAGEAPIAVFRNAQRSYKDVSDAQVAEDFVWVGGAVVLMVVYVSVALGGRPPVRSRVLLSLCSIGSVVLALASAFGLCGFLGVKFNIISQMIMFILLGVGIDDMFIIVGCWDRAGEGMLQQRRDGDGGPDGDGDDEESDEDFNARRLSLAFREAGPSISLTSITDFLAFIIGSTIDLPAVTAFCKAAGIAIVATFALQVTLFSALLVLDERRAVAGKMDCCPCMLAEAGKAQAAAAAAAAAAATDNTSAAPAGAAPAPRSAGLRHFLLTRYGPWLMRPASKVLVLLTFVLLWSVSAWGVTKVSKGLKVLDYIPADSYVHRFFSKQELYFGNTAAASSQLDVLVKEPYAHYGGPGSGPAGAPTAREQQQLAALATLRARYEALPFVQQPLSIWWVEWEAWRAAGRSGAASNSSVASFLAEQPLFKRHVVLDASGRVRTSRVQASFTPATLMDDKLVQMHLAMDACAGLGVDAAVSEMGFLWWARYEMINKLTAQNLSLALLGAFLTLLAFHGLACALIITCVIALVLLNIIGMMGHWALAINVSTLINLVLAVGFTVDYSAHVAEAFFAVDPAVRSRDARAIHAVGTIGASVLNGGLSTLFGVLLLAGAKNLAFVALFKMFFLMVTLGLLHGLVLLPVVLSCIGPLRPAPPGTARAAGDKELPVPAGALAAELAADVKLTI